MSIESTSLASRDSVEKKAVLSSNSSVIDLIQEWKNARSENKTLTNPTVPLTIDFNDHGSIYKDEMNANLNKLTTDSQNAKPNDQTLKADVNQVDKDAQWWTKHESGNATTSPVVADLGKETTQMNKALELINQGKTAEGQAMLNSSVADVKDDLNTLQKADYFARHGDSGTGGGGGGGGGLENAQTFSNLQDQSWLHNTKDLGKTGIGGEGHDPQIQTSLKDGVLTYTSTGGKYTDTLISNGQKFNPKDNTFVLNYTMNRDAATAANANASENDMVITNNTGMQAQAASQFNYSEKAPAGYTWFQTSNTEGHWVNAALVPTPKPGEDTKVSMEVKLDGDNYTYSNLTINGEKIALNPAETTFQMHQSNWTHNEVITQLQEDTNANGGPIKEYYSGVSLQAGTTN